MKQRILPAQYVTSLLEFPGEVQQMRPRRSLEVFGSTCGGPGFRRRLSWCCAPGDGSLAVPATATRFTLGQVPAHPSWAQPPCGNRGVRGLQSRSPGLPLLRGPRWFPCPQGPVSRHPLRPGFGRSFGSSRSHRAPSPSPGPERQRPPKMLLVTACDGDV